MLNHYQHDQHDPIQNKELKKMYSKYRMKTDPKYRAKVIADIEADGVLDFDEAYFWYGYGDGSTIHVDASKLNLGRIDVGKHKVGDHWPIQTLKLSTDYNVGLVYGNIYVEYQGNSKFFIRPDKYDFDIKWKWGWRLFLRNLETVGGSILHGSGTPFEIVFNGFYQNK